MTLHIKTYKRISKLSFSTTLVTILRAQNCPQIKIKKTSAEALPLLSGFNYSLQHYNTISRDNVIIQSDMLENDANSPKYEKELKVRVDALEY